MADDDVTALLSGKKKRKKHKRKRCRVVKRKKLVHGKRKIVKVRKCKPRKKAKPKPPVYVAPAFVPAPPVPRPPAPPRLKTIESPIAVYAGVFGPAQANRLAWRAGFGPRPGQVGQLAALDLEAAVMSFTRPTGDAPLDGPEPMNGTSPINPASDDGAFNYWLDRMVRSRHQLVERLALVFHDWWATRRDGVSTNAEMLNQTNIFRAHGLGSFRDMARAVTTDPAMLQFLDGMSNRRGAVNENYGRELMELFTLGADRGAYTETDVREIAKALSGWTATYDNGWTNWRWDEQGRWDFSIKTVFGKSGRFTWEDAVELVLTHPLHPSFFVRKLWSYFVPTPPDAATSAALEQLYVASGLQIRPVLEAILCSPAVLRGPADGQAAGRADGRPDARDRPRDREQRVVEQERPRRPAALLPAGRLGLERRPLARHEHDRRPLGGRRRRARRADGQERRRRRLPGADGRGRRRRRARLLGRPAREQRDAGAAARLRPGRRAGHRQAGRPRPPAGAAVQRAAPAGRRRPRLPDLLRTSHGRLPLQGTHARGDPAPGGRRPAAGAGAGLRAIEPGMPLPAGTGLSRRSFLARSSGLALAVFGGSALAPRAFEEGIADAMGAARQNTVLVSVFLDGGLDTLSLLAPVDDPTYQTLRPTLKLAPNPALTFAGDPQLQWHGAAAPLKTLHEQNRLTVIPAIGYSSPNQSHFTSRHFYEVGELNESGQVGWLGRWLDRNGRPDNPLQGLSLDTTLAPALAAAQMPVAAVSSPTNYALSTDGVGTTVKTSMN